MRLSLRQPKPTGPKEKVDWKSFSSRPDLLAQYTGEVLNHFHVLWREREAEEEEKENEGKREERRDEGATVLHGGQL